MTSVGVLMRKKRAVGTTPANGIHTTNQSSGENIAISAFMAKMDFAG